MPVSSDDAIERYLRCGEHEADFLAWPGEDYLARARQGAAVLRQALIAAVRQRASVARPPEGLAGLDFVAMTRGKVAPMVRGLFARHEQATVLDVLGRSLVFLTPTTIEPVLARTPWLGTACYLSVAYLGESGRFDDFLVHEAAHIFHNCKRRTIGLRETRHREWLLEIDFARRETFAYACETYSRLHALGTGTRARQALLADYAQGPMPADDRVDVAEYLDILAEAVAARNGWTRILTRCSPSPQRRRA